MNIKSGLLFGLKVVAVGVTYILAMMVAGMVLKLAGLQMPETGSGSGSLVSVVVIGLGMGLCLGPLAARLPVSRGWHLVVWASVMFFNLSATVIEGAFFISTLGPALPALVLMELISTVATAAVITALFAPAGPVQPVVLSRRSVGAWAWRLAVSALSYVVFYWVFGALNYGLVTHTYYETHQAALVVPPAQTILMLEVLRGAMLMLSVLPLALAWPLNGASRMRLAVLCGVVLFVVGGLVPLISNASLPLFLRVASGWEIFFQNFSTGVVVALLLGNAAAASAPARGVAPSPAVQH